MGDEQVPLADEAGVEDPGFTIAKLYPADSETAIAELYFGGRIWAYVSLEGVDQAATGSARVENARTVVEFWREPDKPTGAWDFNLDLARAVEQLQLAETWLRDNEVGRTPSTDEGSSAAGRALSRMSKEQQACWAGTKSTGDEASR